MNTFDDIVNSIDWKELRIQKQWLCSQDCTEAEGLLSLIDAIQDFAVDSGLFSEEEVFKA